jgi:hypothetical protein
MNMRDLITLCESASFTLPSPEVVFPDAEVARTLKQGFDVGKSFNAGEHRYDLDSVHRLLDDAVEDGDYDENDPVQFLTQWLRNQRYSFVVKALKTNSEMRDGFLVIEREILVSDAVVQAIIQGKCPHLGEFWSFRGGEAHWGHTAPNGSKSVFILALVDPANVDWITTIRRNANYNLGDDESEITLRPDTPLTLVNIMVDRKPVQNFVREQKT